MNLEKKFCNLSLTSFLETISTGEWCFYIKRLTGNDTGLTGSHQSGITMPPGFFKAAFPEICTTDVKNPEANFDQFYFASDDHSSRGVRAVYYNNKFHDEDGTRNEFRLTRFGGKQAPVQDPENTGAILVIAVCNLEGLRYGLSWVASNIEEEILIESFLGEEVEPGRFYSSSDWTGQYEDSLKNLIPKVWFDEFPPGRELFDFVVAKLPSLKFTGSPDELLIARRDLEFKVFKLVENEHVLPFAHKGFESVEDFIKLANSVTNRRKSRTGSSLEYNLEHIFSEKNLQFETQVKTENKKKPDFLFPSASSYHDKNFPDQHLHILAVKTCCKDRWRQVINEANRIRPKHLFTLQQGISEFQLNEMEAEGISLVVPKSYKKSFPKSKRDKISDLASFINFMESDQRQIRKI